MQPFMYRPPAGGGGGIANEWGGYIARPDYTSTARQGNGNGHNGGGKPNDMRDLIHGGDPRNTPPTGLGSGGSGIDVQTGQHYNYGQSIGQPIPIGGQPPPPPQQNNSMYNWLGRMDANRLEDRYGGATTQNATWQQPLQPQYQSYLQNNPQFANYMSNPLFQMEALRRQNRANRQQLGGQQMGIMQQQNPVPGQVY